MPVVPLPSLALAAKELLLLRESDVVNFGGQQAAESLDGGVVEALLLEVDSSGFQRRITHDDGVAVDANANVRGRGCEKGTSIMPS